jgi:hypothetical protein
MVRGSLLVGDSESGFDVGKNRSSFDERDLTTECPSFVADLSPNPTGFRWLVSTKWVNATAVPQGKNKADCRNQSP